ncbi:MAG: serine/threonine-protein kinase [Pseudomonadales bacterium]
MDDPDATAVAEPLPQIAGYRTLRLLGAGGMARVYLAEDETLDRPVAIKVIGGGVRDDDMLQRFANEARAIARFRHPNIVTVFTSGESGGTPYIVMDFQPGGTLEAKMADGPLPAAEAVGIATRVADALAYSHERGVVHRDVKPGNVLFGENDEPVLTDFGIAKALDVETHLTRTGFSIGSPRYMSPEQLRGERVDEKTDVYSLGLLLAEMLSGEVPVGGSLNAVRGPGVPRELLALIEACLEPQPADRPSAGELVISLRAVADTPSVAGAARRFVLLGGLLLVGLGGALVWLLMLQPQPAQLRLTPESARVVLDGREASGPTLDLEPGPHRVAVLAADHIGRMAELEVASGEALAIVLKPLTLPDFDQFVAFHERFEGKSEASLEEVTYAPYRDLLTLRSDVLGGATDQVVAWRDRAVALAGLGDPAARMQTFLAENERLVDFPDRDTLEWLRQASDGGFALATYYLALHYRWTNETDGTLSIDALRELRNLMQLAVDQGLAFVAREVSAIDLKMGDAVSE